MSANGSVGLCIPIMVRVIVIWDKLLFNLRVSFDVLVIRKNAFLESSCRIDTRLYLVLEVIVVKRSVIFEFCLDEEFI